MQTSEPLYVAHKLKTYEEFQNYFNDQVINTFCVYTNLSIYINATLFFGQSNAVIQFMKKEREFVCSFVLLLLLSLLL